MTTTLGLPDEKLQQEVPEIPQKPEIIITVSDDRQEAAIGLRRVAVLTAAPLYEDIVAALKEHQVVKGIDDSVLHAICEHPPFESKVVVARGVREQTGRDGFVTYLVSEARELKPKQREDGTVDYHDLGFVQNVRNGQTLCEIYHPEKGSDGYDVYGNVLEGRLGKEPPHISGKNTALNEDNTKLFALCDGDARVKNGTVSVEESLRINSNIDNSTGDIHFYGDVTVNGDVMTGFTIISEGSITINGVVEGARIEAANDITVKGGINGMNSGVLRAGRNIKCKFIQNCTVCAGQNVQTDSVMYSVVECENLLIDERRGVLVGGRATVYRRLSAYTIGTEANIHTQIVVASQGAVLEKQADELEKKIKEISANIIKAMQGIRRYEDLQNLGRLNQEQIKVIPLLKQSRIQLEEEKTKLQEQLEQVHLLQQREATAAASCVVCNGYIHMGVRIMFGSMLLQVTSPIAKSRVYVANDDIVVANM